MEFAVRDLGSHKRAAVRFGDCATNGKPKPHSSGFSGHERLEQAFAIRRRNARAVVSDHNSKVLVIVALHKNPYSTVLAIRTSHRFDRIGKQVPQDNFYLQPVDKECRYGRGILDFKRNRFGIESAFRHTAHRR
jgi:hypothetical protein